MSGSFYRFRKPFFGIMFNGANAQEIVDFAKELVARHNLAYPTPQYTYDSHSVSRYSLDGRLLLTVQFTANTTDYPDLGQVGIGLSAGDVIVPDEYHGGIMTPYSRETLVETELDAPVPWLPQLPPPFSPIEQ